MKYVYIVAYWYDYEGEIIEGVYSNLKLAKKEFNKIKLGDAKRIEKVYVIHNETEASIIKPSEVICVERLR